MQPRLVLVAHGTRHPAGPRHIRTLVRRVGHRLPGVDVVESYVELVEPAFTSVIANSDRPTVVVPLLLSTGYHVQHDLPGAVRRAGHPVTITSPLGPHPLLAAATAMQLRAAGARCGDAAVLVAAGSRSPDATVDVVVAGRLLRRQWGAAVRVGFLSGAGPSMAEAVDALRQDGHRRVVAAPYLLAPGHFATRAATLAELSGVPLADVLGRHRLVTELVVRRYRAAVAPTAPMRRSRVA